MIDYIVNNEEGIVTIDILKVVGNCKLSQRLAKEGQEQEEEREKFQKVFQEETGKNEYKEQ